MEPVKRIEDLGDMAFAEVLLADSMSRVRLGGKPAIVAMNSRERTMYINGVTLLDLYGRLAPYSGLRPEEN